MNRCGMCGGLFNNSLGHSCLPIETQELLARDKFVNNFNLHFVALNIFTKNVPGDIKMNRCQICGDFFDMFMGHICLLSENNILPEKFQEKDYSKIFDQMNNIHIAIKALGIRLNMIEKLLENKK